MSLMIGLSPPREEVADLKQLVVSPAVPAVAC